MQTIDNIRFDTDYSHASIRFLLLNDQTSNSIGPTPVIQLPNAVLMTFIQVFDNLVRCQHQISSQNQKMIKLAIANKNLIDWNENIHVIDHNLNKIYIFCDTFSSYVEMKKWDGCYQNRIADVYMPDEIDIKLLQLGVDYIHTMSREFQTDRGLYRKFCADGKKLAKALADCFQAQMDMEDDPSSEENQ